MRDVLVATFLIIWVAVWAGCSLLEFAFVARSDGAIGGTIGFIFGPLVAAFVTGIGWQKNSK